MTREPAAVERPARAWFSVPKPLAGPRLRLVCLPYAGAGASSFFPWAAALQSAGVEVRTVQYPGRETRLSEPLVTDAAALTQALAEAWPVLAGDGAPCAVFGHSMGALVAYELALELERRGAAPPPVRLFLSGRNPPNTPPKMPPIHGLSDREFIREVATRYGNIPAAILADPEMVAMMTPILRADFILVDGYSWGGAPPIRVPLSVFGSASDPWTSPSELEGWRAFTQADCRVRLFEGDHFFIQKSFAEVLSSLLADLASTRQSGFIPTA